MKMSKGIRDGMMMSGQDLAVLAFDTPPGGDTGGGTSTAAHPETPPAVQPGAAAPSGDGGEGGQPPAGGAQPETFNIKVNGQDVKLTREQALEFASKGHDYTQKTQKLSEQLKAIEKERSEMPRRVYQEVRRLLAEQARSKPAEGQPEGDPEDPAQTALKRVESLEAKMADERLEGMLRNFEKQHGRAFNRHVFAAEAQAAGAQSWDELESLVNDHVSRQSSAEESHLTELLTKADHPLVKAAKERWIAEFVATKRPPAAPPHIPSGTGVAPAGTETKSEAPMTDAQAREAAKAYLETHKL